MTTKTDRDRAIDVFEQIVEGGLRAFWGNVRHALLPPWSRDSLPARVRALLRVAAERAVIDWLEAEGRNGEDLARAWRAPEPWAPREYPTPPPRLVPLDLRRVSLSLIAHEVGRRAVDAGRKGDPERMHLLRRCANNLREVCGLRPFAFPEGPAYVRRSRYAPEYLRRLDDEQLEALYRAEYGVPGEPDGDGWIGVRSGMTTALELVTEPDEEPNSVRAMGWGHAPGCLWHELKGRDRESERFGCWSCVPGCPDLDERLRLVDLLRAREAQLEDDIDRAAAAIEKRHGAGPWRPPSREELIRWQRENAARCGCGGLCDSGLPCPMPRQQVPADDVLETVDGLRDVIKAQEEERSVLVSEIEEVRRDLRDVAAERDLLAVKLGPTRRGGS